MDLETLLPRLLPRAVAWAESLAAEVASRGQPLPPPALADARTVGVEHPERIRLLRVHELPLPADPELRAAALETGLLGPGMAGLTLGYSISIVHGHDSRRVLSHECRHVAQFERAGSIAAFLPAYLAEVVRVGYWDCPFEQDARAHELPDG